MDADLVKLLPGLVEAALDSRHSFDMIVVEKGDDSVRCVTKEFNQEAVEFQIEKH